MKLHELTGSLRRVSVVHDENVDVTSLSTDSRNVEEGALFIALRGGGLRDRHDFVSVAVERGASAILVEEAQPNLAVPQVVVPDVRLAAAILADKFHHHPSRRLKVIGVTGTNGKTTVCQMIDHILTDAGKRTGVLGTIGKRIVGVEGETHNTTPDAPEFQKVLSEMVEAKCDYAITEASSEALDLRRVGGTRYHAAVFTNLTQDHLNYHKTMENYFQAKAFLFSRLGNEYADSVSDTPYGVLNADDERSAMLAKHASMECLTYGISNPADVCARDVRTLPDGISFTVCTPVGDEQIRMALTGQFNVYNALAAITIGLSEGLSLPSMAASLTRFSGVPGRLERVVADAKFTVLVDYSHTPDSLLNALSACRQLTASRLICVVGCGGDRDKGKRPIMAKTAAQRADVSIFTSDNPRTEDPDAILDDMMRGIEPRPENMGEVERIRDRRLAIQRAVLLAGDGDVILIAGKGHETYQIVGTTTYPFDDREVARDAIENLRRGKP